MQHKLTFETEEGVTGMAGEKLGRMCWYKKDYVVTPELVAYLAKLDWSLVQSAIFASVNGCETEQ